MEDIINSRLEKNIISTTKINSKNCYVYVAHDNMYAIGAIVSSQSLRVFDKTNDILVILNENIGDKIKRVLQNLNIRFLTLKNNEITKSSNNNYIFSLMKLECFRLTEYEKIIFIDSDTLIYKDISKYFDINIKEDEILGPSDLLQRLITNNSRLLSTAFFSIKPNPKIYNELLLFGGKNNYQADMNLVHHFYNDNKKIIKDIHMYSNWYYEWIGIPKQLFDNIELIHYNQPKPWDFYFKNNKTNVTSSSIHLYNDWWIFFNKINWRI